MPADRAAPELAGRAWIGPGRPLGWPELAGRAVVVFFWSAADVASLRVAEELRRLDHAFGEELAVIGVHWPADGRSPAPGALARAAARHRLAFPLLDDPGGATAAAFGVTARPALVLVDPWGSVVGTRYGEGHGPSLGRAVGELVALAPPPAGPLPHEPAEPLPSPLAFPAGVAASADGSRLAVVDAGHDRVLVATADGLVLAEFSGYHQPSAARFDGPRVLVADGAAGRAVWSDGEVLADGLAWPSDLVAAGDGSFVVAEAGGHRLARLRPGEIAVRVAAGSGHRGHADGAELRAELDQPAGVTRHRQGVAFVDAGSGTLRHLAAGRRGAEVTTLAGGLDRPTAVAGRPGEERLYVAQAGEPALLAWDGTALAPVALAGALCEPGGLDLLPDGRLVVADTGGHRVVVVDPAGGTVVPVELDETWVHAADAGEVALEPGRPGAVAVHLALVDEELAPPAQVVVRARPASLLAGGEARRAELGSLDGAVELRGGHPGRGLLLVEVRATGRSGRGQAERVRRFRHRLEVAPG